MQGPIELAILAALTKKGVSGTRLMHVGLAT
jgi:hypothetical protein